MQKVEPMGNMDLLVFGLNPSQLVNHLVAPLVHALVANVHLGIQNPKEAETFPGEHLHRDVHYFCV